jgi:hypothetical protein
MDSRPGDPVADGVWWRFVADDLEQYVPADDF